MQSESKDSKAIYLLYEADLENLDERGRWYQYKDFCIIEVELESSEAAAEMLADLSSHGHTIDYRDVMMPGSQEPKA